MQMRAEWIIQERKKKSFLFVLLIINQLAVLSYKLIYSKTCGGPVIEHWLFLNEIMFEDLRYIRHKVVLHYEQFMQGNIQG
jgi:hypothetical protein